METVPLEVALLFIGSAMFGLALAGAGVVLIQRYEFRRREDAIKSKHKAEMDELRAALRHAQEEIERLKGMVAGLFDSNAAIMRHINSGDIRIEAGDDVNIGEFVGKSKITHTRHNT